MAENKIFIIFFILALLLPSKAEEPSISTSTTANSKGSTDQECQGLEILMEREECMMMMRNYSMVDDHTDYIYTQDIRDTP
ncbi:Phytosulfokine [Macleaya cordata]|uniref:Phytosulfokine n=1 Tax=Macleaya cordata TaxID=56857 RepID=A0A200QIK6_MACCD|nr:Phytosulfokine [Macleaya cordata]